MEWGTSGKRISSETDLEAEAAEDSWGKIFPDAVVNGQGLGDFADSSWGDFQAFIDASVLRVVCSGSAFHLA
jgi:hypothetical protein